MILVVLFLLISTFLAFLVQHSSIYVPYVGNTKQCGWKLNNGTTIVCYIMLLLLGIFYSGLRTRGNDTYTYVITYLIEIVSFPSELIYIDWKLGANPGFRIYQSIIKLMFGNNALWLTTVTAIISTVSLIEFYRRYSKDFTLSIYLLVSSSLFIATMAAMKQTLAFSLGIWVLPLTLHKKWLYILILLLLACSIHPYVIFFSAIPFLVGETFSWKVKACILLAVFIGTHLTTFIGVALTVTESIGDEYQLEDWGEGTGVNLLRVPFYLITPFLGFVFRKEVKASSDAVLQICINLSAISGCFMFLATFGGANMFGRMAIYWEPFTYVALPGICKCLKEKPWHKIQIICLIICYFCFYLYYYNKFGYSLFVDYYKHASIFDLF